MVTDRLLLPSLPVLQHEARPQLHVRPGFGGGRYWDRTSDLMRVKQNPFQLLITPCSPCCNSGPRDRHEGQGSPPAFLEVATEAVTSSEQPRGAHLCVWCCFVLFRAVSQISCCFAKPVPLSYRFHRPRPREERPLEPVGARQRHEKGPGRVIGPPDALERLRAEQGFPLTRRRSGRRIGGRGSRALCQFCAGVKWGLNGRRARAYKQTESPAGLADRTGQTNRPNPPPEAARTAGGLVG